MKAFTTLDGLVAGNAALAVSEAVSGAFFGTGANNGLGTFPEAIELSNTYNTVMQTMMTNFREITDLITAMANALGKSAQNYLDTEQQITDSFNQIVAKYENQAGSFSPNATGPTASYGQAGTSGAYSSATTGTTTTSQPITEQRYAGGSDSFDEANNANSSNDSSDEL